MTEKTKDDIDRFRTSLIIDVNPTKDFRNKFTAGIDYRKNEERDFVPKNQVLSLEQKEDI
jgi:hypothetical protein